MTATVYAIFPSSAEAERIGLLMVERGRAACVNILPACRSIYRWEGKVETADEVPALFKVDEPLAAALVDAIAAEHPYEVPAIVVWPATASHPAFADWVAASA